MVATTPHRNLWLVGTGAATAIVIASVVGLVHYANMFGERGLVADASGTAGWSAPGEVVGVFASVVGVGAGILFAVIAMVHAGRASAERSWRVAATTSR